MRLSLPGMFALIPVLAWGQAEFLVLHPTLGSTPDLSTEQFALYEWYAQVQYTEVRLGPGEQARYDSLYALIGETRESPCQVIGMECSWYCGGGPDSVWASSARAPISEHLYHASNTQDLDYCTAWSEGVEGPGIGESVTCRFAADSPRLHTIKISNGKVMSEQAWKSSNRVKRLLLEENGMPVAELPLADSMDDQWFDLPRLFGQRADGRPMLLTFTILEVYPGDHHDDTVITEIWFDGIDVH